MIKFPAKGQLFSKCPFGVFKSNSKTNLWTERASQDHKIVVVVVAAAGVGNMAALQIEAVASAIEAGVEAVEAAAEAVVAAAAAVGNAPS